MKKDFILSYDVHNEHQKIIQELISNGWHSVKKGFDDSGNIVICYLPETTWWKEFENSKQALDQFYTIAGHNNVIRVVVSNFADWRCTTGNPMGHQKEEAMKLL